MVLSPNACVYLAMGIRMDEPFTLSRYCNDFLQNEKLEMAGRSWCVCGFALLNFKMNISQTCYIQGALHHYWAYLYSRFKMMCFVAAVQSLLLKTLQMYQEYGSVVFHPQKSEEMRTLHDNYALLPPLLISIMQKHKHY